MASFNEFICHLIEDSDIIERNFIKNNMITKLINFILYKGDNRNANKKTKGYFEPIIKGLALLFKYYEKNIYDEDLVLSKDEISLLNSQDFYNEIMTNNYERAYTNLLLDYKMCLILAINIKENNPVNDEEIIDRLINKRIDTIKTREEIISYLEILSDTLNQIKLR